ncbi:MAG: ABC transporter permease [Candidatus Marinimicrobia bacterium]|nr:ABC transporter permease [Candidatus Neomarinimicrobiota bacterium]
MKLNKILKFEILKIFSRFRTYIGFLTIAILLPVVMALVKRYGFDVHNRLFDNLTDYFTFTGSVVNGYLISYYLMTILWVHFPFFIILVAGDVVSYETGTGTFRMLLTRPISRSSVIIAKYLATIFYTILIISFLGIFSIVIGKIILGGGDLMVFNKGILILSEKEAIHRFFIAYLLAIWVQIVVASLAFFFSTLAKGSVAPIIGTYAVVLSSIIISILKIDALDVIKPFLFTTYFDIFFTPFRESIPYKEIISECFRLGIFSLAFFIMSYINFVRKDICS